MAPLKHPELHDAEWLAARVAGRVADKEFAREIATELGASYSTVYHALVRADLYVHSRAPTPHPLLSDREWLAALVDANLSNATIAAMAGASKPRVALWVKRHKLIGRRRSGRRRPGGASSPPKIGREWLAARVDAGLSNTEIARLAKVSRSCVAKSVRRYGLTGRRQARKRPPTKTTGKVSSVSYRYREALTVEYLGQRYTREQATVPQIAREVGCSGRAVYDALARHRIPLRGQARGPRPDWTAVLTSDYLTAEYVEAGRDMDDIAGEIGCSAMTVQRALVRHGIPARPARPLDGRVYRDLATVEAISDLDAAEIVGAAQTTASRARRKAGIPPVRGRLPRPVDVGRMIELRAAGLSLWAISVEVGVPVSTVQRRLARVAREREDPPATE